MDGLKLQMKSLCVFICALILFSNTSAQTLIPIAEGWAKNQINAVIFRRNSVTTHKDNQYAAFYDSDSNVVLARRKLSSSKWTIHQTQYKGNTKDAHNSISIAVDGDGFLHIAWNHHGTRLQYARSIKPDSLELSDEMKMIGDKEEKVTYPEFYNLPNSNLLFLYRDGSSGNGNLVLNRYNVKTKTWTRVQSNLIDGEGKRNAYWQGFVDVKGTIHISWVWRESPDVASNHDMCYAKSTDGGKTWRKSSGEKYNLPINAETAEYVLQIPQRSELINQTSMYAGSNGKVYIASYWRPQGTNIPQYHVIYFDGKNWKVSQVSRRTASFSLSGAGTKRIPISRPQIVVNSSQIYLIFRDEERGNRVSVASCSDIKKGVWKFTDLTKESVGMWEPTYDSRLWKTKKLLHLFVQNVEQGDGEKTQEIPPQMGYILEWEPRR